MTNRVLLALWGAAVVVVDSLGNFIASVSGWTNWELVGWAFAGATSFVVWEAVQTKPIKQKGWQRFFKIMLGMFIALVFNGLATKKLGLDPVPATVLLGMLGYKIYGWIQKKGDKPEESIKDLTNMKP